MKVIGIDPGYDRLGWCVAEVSSARALQLIEFGCIQTSAKQTFIERYQAVDQQLSEIVSRLHPTEAAVETLFFSKNQKTAMQVSEVRGVILSALFRQSIKIFEYNPMSIKLAVTGYGNADKLAVEKMVRLQLGRQLVVNEAKNDRRQAKVIDDTLDALAIAMTHALNQR